MSYNLPDGCTEEMIDALYTEDVSHDEINDLRKRASFELKRIVHNVYVQFNEDDFETALEDLLNLFDMNLPKTQPVIAGKSKVSSLKQFAAALVRAEAEMVKKG